LCSPRRRRRIRSLWGCHRGPLRQTIQRQCQGTLFTVQKALPLLNDGGSIILNGSVASVKGTAAFGVYAASKAALRSFVRTWTTDLKDRRIRSNVVSPGPINTPLVSRQSADVIARMVSTIPMGRMGNPRKWRRSRCFSRRTIPVSSRESSCSLTAGEPKSDARTLTHHKRHHRLLKHKAPPAQLPTVLRVRTVGTAGFDAPACEAGGAGRSPASGAKAPEAPKLNPTP